MQIRVFKPKRREVRTELPLTGALVPAVPVDIIPLVHAKTWTSCEISLDALARLECKDIEALFDADPDASALGVSSEALLGAVLGVLARDRATVVRESGWHVVVG